MQHVGKLVVLEKMLTVFYISWFSYVQQPLAEAEEGVVTRSRSQKRKGKVSYANFIPLILHPYLFIIVLYS